MDIAFNKDLDFSYGKVDRLRPDLRRVICPNAGSFTLFGTGTYIIGNGDVAVVDPGPADESHIAALLAATRGERISHILVTHTHNDHSPGCRLLQQHCDAQTWAAGVHGMGRLSDGHSMGGDFDFVPDQVITDGQLISGGDWAVECLYTPGHSINHMSFALSEQPVLLCGDLVMGWSTTIIAPPDGNMKDYMQSLERLLSRNDEILYPAHGAPVADPAHYIRCLYDHRMERINQVMECVQQGISAVDSMVPVIYTELDPAMHPAAAQSVLGSLEYLIAKGQVRSTGELALKSEYKLP